MQGIFLGACRPGVGALFLAISYFSDVKHLTHRCLLRLLELVERFHFCRPDPPRRRAW